MYRSRTAAFFLVLLCAAVFSSGFVYAQEDDGDGNLQCPSVPSLYVYVSGVAYEENIGDKVNLYGKKCVSTENKDVAAEGHCEGPKNCKADICDGEPCKLYKLPVKDIPKPAGEDVPPTPPAPVSPDSNKDSWLNKAFDPVPFSEYSNPQSQSAQNFEDLVKQGGALPEEAEKSSSWLDSVREFFSPPAISPDESFNLQPRDENGMPIPQDVGAQNTMTNPNSTFGTKFPDEAADAAPNTCTSWWCQFVPDF